MFTGVKPNQSSRVTGYSHLKGYGQPTMWKGAPWTSLTSQLISIFATITHAKNVAHIRQSSLDYGGGLKVRLLETFEGVPSSLRSGGCIAT